MKFSPALSVVALVLAAAGVAALLAPLTERGAAHVLPRRRGAAGAGHLRLFLILEDVTKAAMGRAPLLRLDTYQAFGNIHIGPLNYAGYDFMLVLVAVAAGVLSWWVLNRTRQGKIVTAVIHNAEVAPAWG